MKNIDQANKFTDLFVKEDMTTRRELSNNVEFLMPGVSFISSFQTNTLHKFYDSLLDDFKDQMQQILDSKNEDPQTENEDLLSNQIENAENTEVAQEIIVAVQPEIINQGTVQPLPDSGYTGTWGQVDSTPRQLDLSHVRISLPEEYTDFYPLDLGLGISPAPLPEPIPPTAQNDSFHFSVGSLPVNLTLMLDLSGTMRGEVPGSQLSKMLVLQQTLLGEEGLIYALSNLTTEVNIWVVPTPSGTDFYTEDDANVPSVFDAQYFTNDPHAVMEYILEFFPAWDEYYDAAMQYGLDTLDTPNPMFVHGEQNLLYFIADGIPKYGAIGDTAAYGGDPNIVDNWQNALTEYDADAVVIGIGDEEGMADALAPITNGGDPSEVLEPDAALSDLSDLVFSGTQQISGNLLANDDAHGGGVTTFQQGSAIGTVGVPFITALGATLLVNSDGSFTYDLPLSILRDMEDTTENFSYTISNAYGSSDASFEIVVDGMEDTPDVAFSYAVDDTMEVYDDTTTIQTFTGNVLQNDILLGDEIITASTLHTFDSGRSEFFGYLWTFEGNVVFSDNPELGLPEDKHRLSITLYDNGDFELTELKEDGLSEFINANGINSIFSIAYGISGEYGADIGVLEFVLTPPPDQPPAPPVIIDLDGNGAIELSAVAEGIPYDIDNDGGLEQVSWVGPNDGILAFDIEGDGQIEANEFVFTMWDETAKTDMEALRNVFDTNKDGFLSSEDEGWEQFGIWQDGNGNGISEAGEFLRLEADLGFERLDLLTNGEMQDINGNTVHGISQLHHKDGYTIDAYDVSLQYTDIIAEEPLFNNEPGDAQSSAPNLPPLANDADFSAPSQDANLAIAAEMQQNAETFG